jgi:hypothetical protein
MTAWNMTSVAPVLVSGFEVSRRAIPAHSPHGGEKGREGKARVKAAYCAPRSGREP